MSNEVKLSVDCYIVEKDQSVYWYLHEHGILGDYLNDENIFFVYQGDNQFGKEYLLYCLNDTYETEILTIVDEEVAKQIMYKVVSYTGEIRGYFKDKFYANEFINEIEGISCETVLVRIDEGKSLGSTYMYSYD